MKFKERKKERKKEEKKNKEAQLMTKSKERQRKVTSQAKHKLHTENSKKAPPEQMQAPPEHGGCKLPNFSSPLLNFH
jgi:hypothetical protein